MRLCNAAWLTAVAVSPLAAQGPRFESTVPAELRGTPVTGRMYVFVSRRAEVEPRLQVRHESDCTPFFGVDVSALSPGTPAVIDGSTLGYPVSSLKDIPAGDYSVQALLSVYTEFHRADGRTLWLHDDQWEGQQFNVRLAMARALPPVELPPDTKWVKHVKIQSDILSAWWGTPRTWAPPCCSRGTTTATRRDDTRRYSSRDTST